MNGWDSSTRRSRLPGNWLTLRTRVRRRAGGRCEWAADGRRCGRPGSECDHIVAGDNHDLTNLQWLCEEHHQLKTLTERPRRPPRQRKPDPHPGLSV